jgi:hypothetical protein
MVMGSFKDPPSELLTFIMLAIVIGVMLAKITWTTRRIRRLRAEQLSSLTIKVQRSLWGWSTLIFGGLVMTCSGLMLLLYLTMLIDKSLGSDIKMMVVPAILLTVVLPCFFGWKIFRNGLFGDKSVS